MARFTHDSCVDAVLSQVCDDISRKTGASHMQKTFIVFVIQILESVAIMYGEMKEYLYVPSLKEVG